jgi:uncharacterized protein
MNKTPPADDLAQALQTVDEPTRRLVGKQLGASFFAALGLGGLSACGGSSSEAGVLAVTPEPVVDSGASKAPGEPDFGATVRVLCIDGGGIRGAIPAAILTQLESDLGKRCYQVFDVIGGTSTGGLIGAGLSCAQPVGSGFNEPYTAEKILSFYLSPAEVGQLFFPNDSGTTFGATYSARSIEAWLQSKYPSYTLADAALAIKNLPGNTLDFMYTTSYTASATLDEQIGLYLFDWDAASRNAQDNYAVWEAVRATSAAPVYFPLAQVGGAVAPRSAGAARWCCDGGVVANDPVLLSLQFVSQKMTTYARRATLVKKIQIVSIGTGSSTDNLNVHLNGDWGALNWLGTANNKQGRAVLAPLVNVMMASNDSSTTSLMNTLVSLSEFSGPKIEYHRLQLPLKPQLQPMDKTTNAQALADFANQYINDGGAGKTAYNSLLSALKRPT